MKKILFTLLLLLCTTMGWAQTYVGTLAQLKEALKDPSAYIKLTADIDVTNFTDQLCSTFTGTIDGSYPVQIGDSTIYCCHKIYGGVNVYKKKDGKETQEISYKTTTTRSLPLFDKLDNATIKNVAFCHLVVHDDDNQEVGIIARRAVNNCNIANVTIDYCAVYCKKNRGGSLFGYAEYCTFQVVNVSAFDLEVGGVEGGGLVGHSDYCTYEMCFTSFDTCLFIDGEDFGEAAARGGGFVGYSAFDRFIGGMNGALVAAAESQVGGYTGESKYSTFNDCINLGTVAHLSHYTFMDVRWDRIDSLGKIRLDPDQIDWLIGGSANDALGLSKVMSMMLPDNFDSHMWANVSNAFFEAGWEEAAKMPFQYMVNPIEYIAELPVFCTSSLIVLAVIATAVDIAITIFTGDDEVGGISGWVRGGAFERCQNYGPLKCKDDNCGGIVGLGQGVTINNCFNSAVFNYRQAGTTGGMLGAAEANPDDGNKKCKVTNCLSTYGMHIVGHKGYDGMDPTSGNNYRPKAASSLIEPVDCEMIVTEDQIKSGLVSWWLNQGIENRSKGAKPWRQGILNHINDHTVLDPSNPEVELKDLNPFSIDSADKLIAYSKEVENNQFRCGILTADIDMTGREWTPIGKAEQNKHFRGIFDGQGHKITGLKYTSDVNKPAALFGSVHAGAEIRNVIVGEDCEFTCNNTGDLANSAGSAGIVGQVNIHWTWGNVIIENCGSNADIHAARHGGGILGNVVTNNGQGIRVYVNNCFSTGTVTTEDSNSGLLCGYTKNNAVVHHCWSSGQLRNGQKKDNRPYSSNNSSGRGEFLVGYDKDLDIESCYIISPDVNIDNYDACTSLQNGTIDLDEWEVGNGHLTYRLNGYTLNEEGTHLWEQNLGTDAHPVLGSKGIYHTRKMSGKDYGTICVPFPLASNKDLWSVDRREYYIFKEAKEEADGTMCLCFEYVDEVPAGTPALFRSIYNTTYEFRSAKDESNFYAQATTGNDWTFTGTYEQAVFEGDAAETIYYVDGTAHASAIKNAKKTTIAPFRAYFGGPNINDLTNRGVSKAKMRITKNGIEDETTALELIGDDLVPVQQGGKTYSLMGTEVGEDYSGLVIRNGKKVIQNR